MKLYNFKTQTVDDPVTLTDANVTNYYPENRVLDNLYSTRRDLGDGVRQAFQFVLERVTWPQVV